MLTSVWNTLLTTFRPDKLYIDPQVDFDAASETLRIQVTSQLLNKQVRLSREALRKGRGVADGRRFILDRNEHRDFLEAIEDCEWVDNWVLVCQRQHVPVCLKKLRAMHASQTPSVAAIQIHETPLEPRISLELKDPETLIVRQHLTTSSGQDIPVPKDDLSSEWLREANHFFKLPKEAIRPLQLGEKTAGNQLCLQEDQIPEFLEKELPLHKKTSRIFFEDQKTADLRVVPTPPNLSTSIDLDESTNQIVVRPEYHSGTSTFSHPELRKTNRARSFTRRGNTFHKVSWPQIDDVEKALKASGLKEVADGTYRAPTLNLDEVVNTFSKLGLLSETEVLGRFKERLFSFKGIESVDLPKCLKPGINVRIYQKHGFEWLTFLKKHGLPGILADEMGLGKTLQTLLAVAHEAELYSRHPSLVICPAGLVEKWVDEASKFLSGFETLSYTGVLRKPTLRRKISSLDLVVMSYETMTRDIEDLAHYQWRFLIADEAQRVKNPDTQRAKAIRRIRAEARIAITGTPVENRLRDIWSLFDFLATGYLYSEGEFDRKIASPIEQRGDTEAAKNFLRKTRPFILRRLKKDVATELPEKIEKIIRCELTEMQRALYQAVITRDLEPAILAAGGRKISLGNPHIFGVLTKLKQICCHPGLVTNDFQEFKQGVSGKFDAFMEIFDEILDSESDKNNPNKMLIFSQYVPMTTFLQDFVISRKRKCDRIDGSVPPTSRPALCRDYNSDPSRFGMVLTLASGGVGLDLQTANHVVLYDQWWNPAVHSQAIDRVHRIGQTRSVLVFNFITRGTLEEKIEAKLSKKKDIFDLVIRPDEFLKKEVSREELMELVELDR